jgi:hypothetical protein
MAKTTHHHIVIIRTDRPDAVSTRIVSAFEGAQDAAAPSDVIRTTIRQIVEGGGDVGQPAKSAVLGILRGAEVTGVATMDAIRYVAESVIRNTAEAAGDVGLAAKGIVEGSIEGARELDLDVLEAASTAATAALRAARDIGAETGARVLVALTGTIAGVQVLLGGSCPTLLN